MRLDKLLACLSKDFLDVSHRNQLELSFTNQKKRRVRESEKVIFLGTLGCFAELKGRLAVRLRKVLSLDQEGAGKPANTSLIHLASCLQNGVFLWVSSAL